MNSLPPFPPHTTTDFHDFDDFVIRLSSALGLNNLEKALNESILSTPNTYERIYLPGRRLEENGYITSIFFPLIDNEKYTRGVLDFLKNNRSQLRLVNNNAKTWDEYIGAPVLKFYDSWDDAYRSLLTYLREYLTAVKNSASIQIPEW
jgi:hypothetical protein